MRLVLKKYVASVSGYSTKREIQVGASRGSFSFIRETSGLAIAFLRVSRCALLSRRRAFSPSVLKTRRGERSGADILGIEAHVGHSRLKSYRVFASNYFSLAR